ncbi:cupin domain-containing protein [Sphingomonas yunnanensis]|uniref:cupin domain-containing protein n=1 Tax=Sphingomonas yunnanensis TaxID=310400 RepID=UPI001CA7992F|nr:cupin domain-containing protein [Sphingomonas yunnanensis]MBY9063392.1 cupin domain-containing protein [Sphingomonas yunnanensis]
MKRRSVLSLPFATLAGGAALRASAKSIDLTEALLPAETKPRSGLSGAVSVAAVKAGSDRQGRQHQIGVSATTYKVVTSETGGDLFVIEQQNQRRGGPPLHVHHGEDELFYVLDGEYVVQVGDQRFSLAKGDCVLGPRGIPHAWAFTGSSTGRLLLSYAPAGKMEAFFNAWEQLGFSPGGYSKEKDAALLESYGMKRMGPPIQL